ncbi:MAG: glycosyltransferase [Pseudomonadota bacterium]
MKAMLVVTSLMGAGHLQRTLIIARALAESGVEPLVVTGGREISHLDTAGVRLLQLPAVWSDGIDYSGMLTPEGEADQAYLDGRAARLIEVFDDFRPDALITELFPFGRRSLRTEFEALLDHAKGRARIYASVRDVLEPKRKLKRASETAGWLKRWYDDVLVHGDPDVIELSATWPLADQFDVMIHYTGYVAAPAPAPDGPPEVLVSVGGGVIGRALLSMSIEAAREGERTWRLRVGGADAAEQVERLMDQAKDAPVIIEPAAPDYRARLGACACSVSLFGYNTATDLMAAGRPAVIAPMAEGDEKEQMIRADAFSGLPGFTILDPDTSADELAAAVDNSVEGPSPSGFNLGGAAETARLIAESV